MTVVDAHFHCWRLARGDYGWLTPALAPIHRDVEVAHWQREARSAGVHDGVLVQAAPTDAETAFLLEQAAAHEAVCGVVGWLDLQAPDAPERMAHLTALHPKLKALRPMLQDIADPDWILRSDVAPSLQAMAAHGLVFDALVKPLHLPRVLALCERHPHLQVVVDHGAKPDIAAGQWQDWADALARVARETSAVCKLSGLLTEAGPRPRADAARRWAGHVLEAFGPQRVLWGSDWPVLELAASYRDWWVETQTLLAPLPSTEREAVLGGNAARIYRLDLEPGSSPRTVLQPT
jgi:L-fuconolactonase